VATPAASPVAGADQEAGTAAPVSAEVPAPAGDPALVTIDAPMLGTFYRAPKPGDPPYCDVGGKVIAGDVIGLVEVMKMMNPVLAPADGEIHRVLAADNALVEFGQALFEMRVTPGGDPVPMESMP
jgi:acetyl-CoA carboxylase biotin carboxyl carrier protein